MPESYSMRHDYGPPSFRSHRVEPITPRLDPRSPQCFGLTRLSGSILFGVMAFLAIASIAGLIVSAVLYANESSVDPQWKILGMVVCAVMLLTVVTTFLIFIYCYKKGHLLVKEPADSLDVPSYYPQPMRGYGMLENVSPSPTYDPRTVRVQDKLTNTEKTHGALPLRDGKRGVWPGTNAYGGVMRRPVEPPRMAHRVAQAVPHEIDAPSKRPAAAQPKYDVIEEIYETSRKRKPNEQLVEYVVMPKQRARHGDVTVQRVRPMRSPDVDDTDHFYE